MSAEKPSQFHHGRRPYETPELTCEQLALVTLGGTTGGGDSGNPGTQESPGPDENPGDENDRWDDDGWDD